MHGRLNARRHESQATQSAGIVNIGLAASSQLQVTRFAHKYSAILRVHAAMEKGQTAVQVFYLAGTSLKESYLKKCHK